MLLTRRIVVDENERVCNQFEKHVTNIAIDIAKPLCQTLDDFNSNVEFQ